MTTTILEFGIIILAAIILTGSALLITYCIEKRKQILDSPIMMTNFFVILTIFLGIMFTVGFYFDNLHDTYETNTFTNNISDVNSNNIILENGTVLFIGDIHNFNYKLGNIHEITIETHKNYNMRKTKFMIHQKIIDVKIIEKQKKTNDRKKEARTLKETKGRIC